MTSGVQCAYQMWLVHRLLLDLHFYFSYDDYSIWLYFRARRMVRSDVGGIEGIKKFECARI